LDQNGILKEKKKLCEIIDFVAMSKLQHRLQWIMRV